MTPTVRESATDVIVRPSYDDRETAGTFPWRSIGFYALIGQYVITFKPELVKKTIVEALEQIRKQNPAGRILIAADNYASHHATITQERADELGLEFVFPHRIRRRSTRSNRYGKTSSERFY